MSRADWALFFPCRPVVQDPIQQGSLETNVFTAFFALDPFVPEDFFTLGQKFPVEHGGLRGRWRRVGAW